MPVLCACVRPCLFRANTPLIAWHLLTPLTSPNILLSFREWCGFAPLPTSAPRFDPISRALAPERYTYTALPQTQSRYHLLYQIAARFHYAVLFSHSTCWGILACFDNCCPVGSTTSSG